MSFHHQAKAVRQNHCISCSSASSLPRHPRLPGRLLLLLLVALIASTSLLGTASAASLLPYDRHPRAPSELAARLDDPLRDTLVPAALDAPLLVDTSEPLIPPPFMPPAYHGDATETTGAASSKRAVKTDGNASSSDFQIPTAFDSTLSNNFTQNCATFFKTMLTSDTMTTCHPFSLLLRTSSALFEASKSFVRITQTLEATCGANSTQCTAGINDLANQLISEKGCGVDYDNNNPQVVQAYNGLIAYEPMYLASCLKDDDGDYCYANAVTNATSQGVDSVPFYLPLGVAMGGGSRPTCNACLQDEMAIFSQFATNTSQPLSRTYASAADTVSMSCGTAFINVTAAPLKAAAPSSLSVATTPTISLLIMLFFLLVR